MSGTDARPLRVGLIGAGVMGAVHAQAWQRLPGVLSAMYTPDESARRLARQYNLTGCDTLEDLHAQVDILDICTPTLTHRPLALGAAQAGLHVICEKPLALSLEDARAIVTGCRNAGVRLFVAQVVRFFPPYREARRRVAAGEIGSPRVLRLSRVGSPPPPGSWLHDEAQSGGVPVDLMIHDLDYARWVAGEVESVYAVQGRRGHQIMVQATLRHVGGAISFVEGGWAAPAGVFRTSLDLAGTAGLIQWTSDQPPALLAHGPAVQTEQTGAALPAPEGDPYADELEHAYHSIQTGEPFLVSDRDALSALSLGLAVRHSLESAQAVSPMEVAL